MSLAFSPARDFSPTVPPLDRSGHRHGHSVSQRFSALLLGILGASLVGILAACEASPKRTASDQDATEPANARKALIVSTVDPLSSPWRASVLHVDPESLGVRTLLSGESGDPAFFAAGSQVLLFNRSVDSKNMRRLYVNRDVNHDETVGTKAEDEAASPKALILAASPQIAFGGGDSGDPHDALPLGKDTGTASDRILLAHYNEGRLTVISGATGHVLETINADWDLPQGATFKPEALVPMEDGAKRQIWVVHQAMMIEGGVIRANGSQQVFLLEEDRGALRPVDLDPSTPRIQGIKIKGSFPLAVRSRNRRGLLLVSLCSRYVAYASSMAGEPCHSAVEEILPEAQAASLLWDLEGSEFFMNGPVTPGPSPHQFYANVDHRVGPNRYEQKVALFDLNEKKAEGVYTFPADSGGFWFSGYDEATRVLYIGDVGRGSVGQISALRPDGSRQTVPLPGVPYSGILFSQP